MEAFMQYFHKHDFVHGDLREPNILCDGDRVKLIDFDWGGKVDEAYYPSPQLCSELTDGRDAPDLKITKEDDIRVLGNTCKKLEQEAGPVWRFLLSCQLVHSLIGRRLNTKKMTVSNLSGVRGCCARDIAQNIAPWTILIL